MSRPTEHTVCSTGYDPDTDTYRTTFGPQARPPSEAIVTAVATLTDRPPRALPPLHDTIDIEALDTMFLSTQRGTTPPEARLSFTYYNHSVTVNATGVITVCPHQQPE